MDQIIINEEMLAEMYITGRITEETYLSLVKSLTEENNNKDLQYEYVYIIHYDDRMLFHYKKENTHWAIDEGYMVEYTKVIKNGPEHFEALQNDNKIFIRPKQYKNNLKNNS